MIGTSAERIRDTTGAMIAAMPRQAPRIDPRLAAAVPHLDNGLQPIAETVRAVGLLADAIGATRPSYEQVRLLVHAARDRKEARAAALELILDVQFRRRPPHALLDLLGS